jgi:hypothetical protein
MSSKRRPHILHFGRSEGAGSEEEKELLVIFIPFSELVFTIIGIKSLEFL